MNDKRIIIITGHYGAGKTNFAVNLALHLRESNPAETVAIADLDIVNPFFRTADFAELFARSGIKLAKSDYANSGLDIPAVNLDVAALSSDSSRLIIDVGGDGEGAKALGRFAPQIRAFGYSMCYVFNMYRYLTRAPEQAVAVMRDIERASGLTHTALLNNSNLGEETTPAIVSESELFAAEVAELAGLPLYKPGFDVKRLVKCVWE